MKTLLKIGNCTLVLPASADVGKLYKTLASATPVEWDHHWNRPKESMDFRARYKPSDPVAISVESVGDDQLLAKETRIPKSRRLPGPGESSFKEENA